MKSKLDIIQSAADLHKEIISFQLENGKDLALLQLEHKLRQAINACNTDIRVSQHGHREVKLNAEILGTAEQPNPERIKPGTVLSLAGTQKPQEPEAPVFDIKTSTVEELILLPAPKLKVLAQKEGIEGFEKMNKRALATALYAVWNPEGEAESESEGEGDLQEAVAPPVPKPQEPEAPAVPAVPAESQVTPEPEEAE